MYQICPGYQIIIIIIIIIIIDADRSGPYSGIEQYIIFSFRHPRGQLRFL